MDEVESAGLVYVDERSEPASEELYDVPVAPDPVENDEEACLKTGGVGMFCGEPVLYPSVTSIKDRIRPTFSRRAETGTHSFVLSNRHSSSSSSHPP